MSTFLSISGISSSVMLSRMNSDSSDSSFMPASHSWRSLEEKETE
jgi:hypothetical protein